MGPYCKFCNQRCFTHMPAHTPPEILAAYGSSTIIATCPAGQQFERDKVGYCYDDIQRAIAAAADDGGGGGGGYPPGWPRCPGCGEPALDGHITCGDVRCNEAEARKAVQS